MKNILFNIYTGEFPNQFAGGPNNIIYKLIQSATGKGFGFDYLSSDLFFKDISKNKLINIEETLSVKKKTAHYLFQKSRLYQKLTTSDYYLPIHFSKKNKYFRSFQNAKNDYNIIHSHDSISLGLISNQENESKKILTIHSKGPLSDELRRMPNNIALSRKIDKKLKAIEKRSLELADIITFPSKVAKSYFENDMQTTLDNTKVKIIYNGVDIQYIKSIETDDNILEKYLIERNKHSLIVLNIAAHVPEKNISTILGAINLLKFKYKKNVLLINVGRGSQTNELKKLSKKLQINDRVKFFGKLENEEVIKLLKVCDIFLMASEKVIFDLVVLEALACGIVCIISNEGGNKEIITDGKNGYLIEVKNADAIAKRIISVDYNNVRAEGLKSVNNFLVDRMIKEYFELYENLTNGV